VKRQKLEALLSEHGCVKIRDKGKHAVWKASDGAMTSVPRHNEIKKFTARNICKALGIDPQLVTN
jgi:predicted RNA binding protein YcfA (HicA-like mRNA interferase family)